MTDITRYTPPMTPFDDGIIDQNGEFVKFEDHEKRVESQLKLLEVAGRRIEELEEDLKRSKAFSELKSRDIDLLRCGIDRLNDLQKDL